MKKLVMLAATAINALLLTIFMPALTKVKNAGKRIVCLNQSNDYLLLIIDY
jgi:hypothetical protein